MNVPPAHARELKALEGKSVLVTGGTGFIGRHLVRALLPACRVIVLSRKATVPGAITVNADITDPAALIRGLEQHPVDIVFHTAGNTNAPGRTNDLDHFMVNATGTRNLLEVSRDLGVSRFVYSSSMEVYGRARTTPVSETHPVIPETFYGMSKYLGEVYCSESARNCGVPFTTLRYSYVYGPGLPEYRAISRFIHHATDGEPLQLFNGGRYATDYVYVGDVVTANLLAATAPVAKGQVYNIGSGTATSVRTVAETVVGILQKGRVIEEPVTSPVPPAFALDIAKASRDLRFTPSKDLREGLKGQINSMITKN